MCQLLSQASRNNSYAHTDVMERGDMRRYFSVQTKPGKVCVFRRK